MTETLGKKIQKVREIKGFSQEYMARKLNISQEQYSYIEINKKQYLRVRLQQLLKF